MKHNKPDIVHFNSLQHIHLVKFTWYYLQAHLTEESETGQNVHSEFDC